MNISDLIAELQKFPELSSVYLQTDDGQVVKIDSVHQLWVKHGEGYPGPITETRGDDNTTFEADDFGALLYG